MRLPYLLTLCLLVCNCAWAQPLPPDTPALDEGSLHGQVICDDGLPFEGATGTVSGAGQTVDFTTDKDGFFLVTLKAGAASILIADTVTKTLIQAGTTVAAQARVKRPGVVVTVHGADGKAYTGVVNGEAFGTDNSWRDCTVHPLGEGRYWFFEAGVTLVKLAATIPTVNDEPTRTVPWGHLVPVDAASSLQLPAQHPLRLHVVDAQGQPIVNGKVDGILSYLQDTPWWTTSGDRVTQVDYDIDGLKMDATGDIDLGNWPPMRFVLSLYTAKTAGASVSGQLKEDGTCTLARYTLGYEPRTVRQTVFDRAGKPVPNAAVRISYCWSGRLAVNTATADDAGIVTWTNLPPVRAITWDGGTAPAMLPAEATTVTTPLPCPVPGAHKLMYFTQSIDHLRGVAGIYSVQSAPLDDVGELGDGPEDDTAHPIINSGNTCTQNAPAWGTPFSIGTLYSSSPPKMTTAFGVYMPYVDDARPIIVCDLEALAPTHQDGADVTLHLCTADGKPVPEVSRIRVVPATPQKSWSLFGPGGPSLCTAAREKEGVWHLALPAAGTYRLCVDLLDADTPLLDALLLKVEAGKAEVTVTLPAPLFSLPPGTTVHWLTKQAPTAMQRLTVANTPDAPVALYGQAEALRAVWYAVGNTLHAFVPGATPEQRTLTARQFHLTARYTNGNQVNGDYFVGPLFPMDTNGSDRPDDVPMPAANNADHTEQINPNLGVTAMWVGKYPVLSVKGRGLQGILDVPDADRDTIFATVSAPEPQGSGNDAGLRRVRFRFPAGDYAAMRTSTRADIVFVYDVPFSSRQDGFGRSRLQALNILDGDVLMLAPQGATRVSIFWLGVGVLSDVPLPKNGPVIATVILPAWQDGAVLTGVSPHGVSVRLPGDDDTDFMSPCDANGRFQLKGLLPGATILRDSDDFQPTLLELPATGLRDVIIHDAGDPVFSLTNNDPALGYWWVPDDGKPMILPHLNNLLRMRDLPDHGAGWLWCVGNLAGKTYLRRFLPEDGLSMVTATPLSISLPFDLARLPGAVHLNGSGALAGMTVDFPEFTWQYSPYLGITTAMLDVPPGTYTVRVDTPAGPLEAPVTVTLGGGSVAFPAK